jgi:hypothetical protein
MNAQTPKTLPPPPGVMGSLQAGFDAVSNHITLILLPFVLDLFLWLGPRLSAGNLYNSLLREWVEINNRAGLSIQNLAILEERVDLLGLINVLTGLRTFPIGIPSLLSGMIPESLPLRTPLGIQSVIQIPSVLHMLGWTVALTLAGWIGGGLYFRSVSIAASNEQGMINPWRAIVQTGILSLVWWIGLLAVLFPALMVLSLLALVSPLLANGAAFVAILVSFWLIVPLFFMPHGIFVRRQNALHSMFASLSMSRFTLPTSSLFVFSVIILSTGLNYLWSVPSGDSWMMLVGIAGHAFITTVLLAASFIYYRDTTDWLKNTYERFRSFRTI